VECHVGRRKAEGVRTVQQVEAGVLGGQDKRRTVSVHESKIREAVAAENSSSPERKREYFKARGEKLSETLQRKKEKEDEDADAGIPRPEPIDLSTHDVRGRKLKRTYTLATRVQMAKDGAKLGGRFVCTNKDCGISFRKSDC
jgi:hypothetical protein